MQSYVQLTADSLCTLRTQGLQEAFLSGVSSLPTGLGAAGEVTEMFPKQHSWHLPVETGFPFIFSAAPLSLSL